MLRMTLLGKLNVLICFVFCIFGLEYFLHILLKEVCFFSLEHQGVQISIVDVFDAFCLFAYLDLDVAIRGFFSYLGTVWLFSLFDWRGRVQQVPFPQREPPLKW